MTNIKCKRCGFEDITEKECELHHHIPRSIGGTDKDGRVWLCKKCHKIFHYMIPKIIFNNLKTDKEKEELKILIRKNSLKYVGVLNDDKNNNS